MELAIYQVDAFSDRVFGGNPAAVVPLAEWLPDATLQAIASENNLAETAFFVPREASFGLRWFTPEIEMDLCGHATLAAAHVIFQHRLARGDALRFETRSGELIVERREGRLAMDFPARPAQPRSPDPSVAEALGCAPRELLAARDLLAVFGSQAEVEKLSPDFAAIAAIDTFAVIASAPGDDCDFVSRFFAPRAGVDEDPVTGSAHCTLIPYWSRRLGKRRLRARQVSRRGGELFCEDRGERVEIAGHAVEYLRGQIFL